MTDSEKGPYETATMRGGLRHNLQRYRFRVTGERSWARYLWQGTVLTLLSDLPTVVASVVRAKAYRTVLGGIGRGCFIERNVRLLVPRRIYLGNRVMIGERCFVDANTPQGRIEIGRASCRERV